jgi:hypothetical protein
MEHVTLVTEEPIRIAYHVPQIDTWMLIAVQSVIILASLVLEEIQIIVRVVVQVLL